MAINMFEGARRIAKLIAVFFVVGSLLACGDKGVPEDSVFTLYQNAPSDAHARMGIATFDLLVMDSRVNHQSCTEIAELLQADWKFKTRDKPDLPEVKNFRYWCEKGRYKP